MALADDELILGHRDSEWTGHAPILEEDIAFANIAQDEIGHASLWYGLVHDLGGPEPDRQVFFRQPSEYRNAPLVELPKGDWAFSMLRQYLFDAAEAERLPLLAASAYATAHWPRRRPRFAPKRSTICGTPRPGSSAWRRAPTESHRRVQAALDLLWPYALQLFAPTPGQDGLAAGVAPEAHAVRRGWQQTVVPFLSASQADVLPARGRAGRRQLAPNAHPHLADLLADMQSVARSEGPDVQW